MILRFLVFAFVITADYANANENCSAYAPSGDWPEAITDVNGADWPMAFFPIPGLSMGAYPVQACRQLRGFKSNTQELESADARYPAVVHTYEDRVAPFVGLFAPMQMSFRGQSTFFGIAEIGLADVSLDLAFSAPPSGAQLTRVNAYYRFANGNGRRPSETAVIEGLVSQFGPFSTKAEQTSTTTVKYLWLVKDGALIAPGTDLACTYTYQQWWAWLDQGALDTEWQTTSNMRAVDQSCDGEIAVTMSLNADVPEFVDRLKIRIEDRALNIKTSLIDQQAAIARSDQTMARVNSPDGELNIRSGPSLTDEIYGVIYNDDLVWIGQTSGNWSYIAGGRGLRGWAASSLLTRN
ncbi:SH3 domain-containing protein [Parasulfitobacter algicola]|uniref:SH3 domain-containing protein n=1 Tax=Parasulfitobacter algicola TaxID=2614809 RepID=A0ABX2IPH1_9RHOB|nr:SH3 domain-containing protein [Sulfitobacter algicola]NSX54260.1 SH3 domain-containing protein [Sulfitobacter algicola]